MITVKELAMERGINSLWLCPNIITDVKFNQPSYLEGTDCTINTIPEEVANKPVIKKWTEGKQLCIVWENEPYKP